MKTIDDGRPGQAYWSDHFAHWKTEKLDSVVYHELIVSQRHDIPALESSKSS